jgi:hypothetical protein
VLAPYLLTALVERPGRLVYLSSGMHRGGTPSVADLDWNQRRWNPAQAYSDSKLFDTGQLFYHQRPREAHPAARSRQFQDELLGALAELTGTKLPG